MSFFQSTLLHKKDLLLINSDENPTLPSVGEVGIFVQDDGITYDLWDREIGGSVLRYRTANNDLLDNWGSPTNCTGLPSGIFPTLFKYNGEIYLLWKHNSNNKFYLYTTTDKIAFTLVSATPILEPSTTDTDWNRLIFNVGCCVVGNKLHILLEGAATTGFYSFPSNLGYCLLNLDTLELEIEPPVAIPTVYNSLCPCLIYSRENNGIAVIYSSFDLETSNPPTEFMGKTKTMTALLSDDLTNPNSWEISTLEFPELNEDPNVANQWSADFEVIFTPNKTYPMFMFYVHTQSTGYQAYADIKNEAEFFTSIKFAGTPK